MFIICNFHDIRFIMIIVDRLSEACHTTDKGDTPSTRLLQNNLPKPKNRKFVLHWNHAVQCQLSLMKKLCCQIYVLVYVYENNTPAHICNKMIVISSMHSGRTYIPQTMQLDPDVSINNFLLYDLWHHFPVLRYFLKYRILPQKESYVNQQTFNLHTLPSCNVHGII